MEFEYFTKFVEMMKKNNPCKDCAFLRYHGICETEKSCLFYEDIYECVHAPLYGEECKHKITMKELREYIKKRDKQ